MNNNPPSAPHADRMGNTTPVVECSRLVEDAVNFGYRPIPVFSDGNRAPYGRGQFYSAEAHQWKNAIHPALALDNLILVDFDGYKGDCVTPDEFANHFGIDDRTMGDALFQWDEERNSSHYLFKWPAHIPRDSSYNQTLTDVLEINGKRHVDLKTGNQLVSLKPGKRIKWRPVAGWSTAPEKLVAFFRKPERDTAKPPNGNPPKPLTRGDGSPYGLSALRSACDTVRGAAKGGRNAELNAQSCAMGSLVAGGELMEQLVRTELEAAAEAAGLHPNEIRATIQSGMSAGIQQPRSAPPRPERPPPCPRPTNSNVDRDALQTDIAAWQDGQSASPVPPNNGDPPPLSAALQYQRESLRATQQAWHDAQNDTAIRGYSTPIPPQRKSRLSMMENLSNSITAPKWLVKNWFESDVMGTLVAPSYSGKSFLALDLACSVATGTPWQGKAVQKGAVIYIAGEGFNGIKRRLRAWEIKNETTLDGHNFLCSDSPYSLGRPGGAFELVVDIVGALGDIKPVLIVVDTVARNTTGREENSATDTGVFVDTMGVVQRKYGCTILLVHHTGHGNQERGRGSSALYAAQDCEYLMKKDELGTIELKCTKMKDGLEPKPINFQIVPVELGIQDEDGEEVVSAVLVQTDKTLTVESKAPKLTGNHEALLQAVRSRKATGESTNKAVVRDDLKTQGLDTKNFSRWLTFVIDAGLASVSQNGDIALVAKTNIF